MRKTLLLVSPSLHADDFHDDKLTSMFCDHIMSFFFRHTGVFISVGCSVKVLSWLDLLWFHFSGAGLCSSAAVCCSRWVGSFSGLSISVLVGFWLDSACGVVCRQLCGQMWRAVHPGQVCSCDYSCFVHGECCKDFEDVCTVGKTLIISQWLLFCIYLLLKFK